MRLPEENRDELLSMALLLNNQLSWTHPDELRRHTTDVMEQLCFHLKIPHAHFLVVRRAGEREDRVSLYAEWSLPPAPELGVGLHKVNIHFFGDEAVETLQSGQPYFSTFDSNNNACSKLVSGILRELGLRSYEMIPIILQNRLMGIIGLAHNGHPEDLDGISRNMIQMIGNSLMQTIVCVRRERVRRRHHRQWKRVANGACDFALRVDSRLEITGVIPFRRKSPPQLTGLPLSEFVAISSCESVLEIIQESVSTSEPRLVQFYAINESARPCSYVARVEPAPTRSRRRDLTLYLTNNDVERAHADELAGLREQLDRSARLSLLGNIATEFAYQLTLPLAGS